MGNRVKVKKLVLNVQLVNPLSTRDLSIIASFMSSLIGGPIKILPQCRFSR